MDVKRGIIMKCNASCRDGTDCLNNAKVAGLCWKHRKILRIEKQNSFEWKDQQE